jgi:hypothetical protein
MNYPSAVGITSTYVVVSANEYECIKAYYYALVTSSSVQIAVNTTLFKYKG